MNLQPTIGTSPFLFYHINVILSLQSCKMQRQLSQEDGLIPLILKRNKLNGICNLNESKLGLGAASILVKHQGFARKSLPQCNLKLNLSAEWSILKVSNRK